LLSTLDDIQNEIDDVKIQIDSVQGRIHDSILRVAVLRARLQRFSPTDLTAIPSNLTKDDYSLGFAGKYKRVTFETSLQAPQYQLPLETVEISNFQSFSSKITLSDAALEMLERNGFVVIENPFDPREEDISRPYEDLMNEDIPIFITSDSLLHLYHIQFSETLRRIEEEEFYDDIWWMSMLLLGDSIEKYEGYSGDLKEAAKRNVAYFSVGLSLLQPKDDQMSTSEGNEFPWIDEEQVNFTEEDLEVYRFEVPQFVASVVEEELDLIEAHQGFARSPVFVYREDYSQYVPRGHYTRSEKLKNYFKAMMWYGRISLLLKGSNQIDEGATSSDITSYDALISTFDAKIQTMQASLIASKFSESESLKDTWDRIYAVTSFYVGLSDDLGPNEYIEALNSVFDGAYDPSELDDDAMTALKVKLAEYRSPEIYGGTGEVDIFPPLTPEQADEILEATKGFR